MKKIILLTFLIFGTILFWMGYAGAQEDCASAGGTCKSQCESNEAEEIDSGCPSGICCVSDYENDCYSLGGSCQSSCGSGEIEESPSSCQNDDVCCVADDSGGTNPTGDTSSGGTNPTGDTSTSSGEKCSGDDFEEIAGVCFPSNTGLAETPIADILKNALFWLLGIFGFFGIAGFVISGIQYLVSAGNEKGIETAKRNMKWSLVGVVVGISGMVIIKAITAALEATTSSF